MKADKDLLLRKPLVLSPTRLEQEMYQQITMLNKQVTAIKQILEGCNEK